MSYQLEKEMEYRVNRYRSEAATRRAVPRGMALRRLALGLRSLADRLEERATGSGFPGDSLNVVPQGRNQ